MIFIKKDRSAVIPGAERHIGFENDHLVEKRFFCVEDTALADFTFKLDIDNTDVVSLTPVTASEAALSGMLLEWDITRDALGSGGVICAQLRAFDADGNRVWHSEKMEFTAGESVHAVTEASAPVTITEFEQIEQKVTQTLTSMDAVYEDVTEKYGEIVQMGDAYSEAMETVATLSEKATAHYADKTNPHGVTAGQVGAYSKAETDTALAGKLNKVKSDIRVYPGIYATTDTDGTPQLITATSDLSYIGTGGGYIPLYAPGGQLKTAEPTADDAAANKAYVDAVKADLADKLEESNKAYELIETITLTEATNLIERNTEPDGTVYSFAKVLITVDTPKTDTAAQQNVRLYINDGTLDYYAYYQSLTTYAKRAHFDCAVENGLLKIRIGNGATNYGGENTGVAAMIENANIVFLSAINKIKLKGEATFAVGTVIKIYGVRA